MNQSADSRSLGPARPEKLSVEYFEQPDGIAIRTRKKSGPGCFLFLWLIGWSVGCVVLAVAAIREPAWTTILFGIPFWASWIFVASFLAWLTFGRESVLIGRDEVLFLRTVFFTLSSRAIPRSEVRGCRQGRSTYQENDQYLYGIELVTLGKPLKFAFRLPDLERAWLIFQINRQLGTVGFNRADKLAAAEKDLVAEVAGAAVASTLSNKHETLDWNRTLAEPPSDCRWRLEEEPSSFQFLQRGKFSFGAFAVALFINLFWNGIVSVFVLGLFGIALQGQNAAPQGFGWWGLFFFLIPFEVIGLVMFIVLLMVLAEPFRRSTWRFEHDQIIAQSRWPFFRRTRSWTVTQLDRLELRKRGETTTNRPSASDVTDLSGSTQFDLAFVGSDNADLCSAANFTEGEARWIARTVLDRRPEWFGQRFRR